MAGATPEHDPLEPSSGDYPSEETPFQVEEEETPRRAASAEFLVDTALGSQARLREAMDPANQSLREALRLSFRVLQAVIVVLIVLFIFSGFQTVETGQSGVMLRWGKILTVKGREALEPGLQFSKWPYPAGEFVLFRDSDRVADVGDAFWPRLRSGQSLEDAVQAATVNQMLRPGRDGSLLTAGGDIAHVKLRARYNIESPPVFVHCVEDDNPGDELDGDRLVELALQRAAVHVAARLTLQELVDFDEVGKAELAQVTQETLDAVGSGITVVSVETPVDPTPALAIKKAFGDLQEAKVEADEVVVRAREEAKEILIGVAGAGYPVIVDLIGRYEDAIELGGHARADPILATINEELQNPTVSGEVTAILELAKSHRSQIEFTLGFEARRFRGLLASYREHPELVIRRLWLETYSRVLSNSDAEIFYVPPDVGMINVTLVGSEDIREIRRKYRLDRGEQEAWDRSFDPSRPYIQTLEDMERRRQGKAGRQLPSSGRGTDGGR